jgi:hypothetical protein
MKRSNPSHVESEKKKTKSTMHIPDDIYKYIFSFVDVDVAMQARGICKQIQHIVESCEQFYFVQLYLYQKLQRRA